MARWVDPSDWIWEYEFETSHERKLLLDKNEKTLFLPILIQKLSFLAYYVILGRAGPDRAVAHFFGMGRAGPGPGKIFAEFSSLVKTTEATLEIQASRQWPALLQLPPLSIWVLELFALLQLEILKEGMGFR